MYIRRKVFSVLNDENGEQKLFSVNETTLYDEKMFGVKETVENAYGKTKNGVETAVEAVTNAGRNVAGRAKENAEAIQVTVQEEIKKLNEKAANGDVKAKAKLKELAHKFGNFFTLKDEKEAVEKRKEQGFFGSNGKRLVGGALKGKINRSDEGKALAHARARRDIALGAAGLAAAGTAAGVAIHRANKKKKAAKKAEEDKK